MALFTKLVTLSNIMKLYSNWWTVLGDVFGFKSETYISEIREGLFFKVRGKEKDINIINEVFISGSYNTAFRSLKKDSTIIDIGGHIGAFTVFSSKVAKNGKIYCYEPFKGSYNLLKDNLHLNKLSNVKAFNMAVTGNKQQEIKLYIKTIGNDFAGNSIYGSGNSISVKSTNLEEIFRENGIGCCDLLKIDCEGAEYDIILNAPKSLFKKVKNVVLEYHTPFGDPKKLKIFLEECGFKVIEETNGVYFASKTP